MLDDLRNDASSSFEDTLEPTQDENDLAQLSPRRRSRPPFLGMGPGQRFAIALLALYDGLRFRRVLLDRT